MSYLDFVKGKSSSVKKANFGDLGSFSFFSVILFLLESWVTQLHLCFKVLIGPSLWCVMCQDIECNEAQRKELQRLIDEAIDSDRNKTFLRILSQYRLLVSFICKIWTWLSAVAIAQPKYSLHPTQHISTLFMLYVMLERQLEEIDTNVNLASKQANLIFYRSYVVLNLILATVAMHRVWLIWSFSFKWP